MTQTVSTSPKPIRFFDLPQELQDSIVEKLNPLTLDDAKTLINLSRTSNRGQKLIRSVIYENPTNLMKISSLSYSLQMRGKYYNCFYPLEDTSHFEFSNHQGGTARYVDSKGKVIHTFSQNGYCSAIQHLPNGDFLVGSNSKQNTLRVINPQTGISATLKQEAGGVRAIALLSDSKAVTISILSKNIYVYDLNLKKIVNQFPRLRATSLAALQDDHFIVSDSLQPSNVNLYHADKGHIDTLYSYPNIIEIVPLPECKILIASQQFQTSENSTPPLELHIINMQGELLATYLKENTYDKKIMIELWPNNKIAITNFKRENLNNDSFQKRIKSDTTFENKLVAAISKSKIEDTDEFMREIDLIDLKEFTNLKK